MFRRTTWLGVGLVAGFGASKWVERKIRRRIKRYLPVTSLPVKAAGRAREIVADASRELQGAVAEARAGMEETEAQLRARVAARPEGRARAQGIDLVQVRRRVP